jgi:hypothetical protein
MLADTIDVALPDDQWFPYLSDRRQPEVKGLHAQKTGEDFDTRLIDCTTLSDKATIIRKLPDLLKQLGLSTTTKILPNDGILMG